MKVISRQEAKALGLKRYFTNQPCKNGHIAERSTSNSTCLICQNENAKKAYKADSSKAKNRRKKYFDQNREAELEKMRVYNENNKDKHSKVAKKRYQLNIEEKRLESRIWAKNNRPKRRAQHAKRRLAVKNSTPFWYSELDEFVFNESNELSILRSVATGFDWHVDHMVPLRAKTVCGLHVWNNFQVIPAKINIAKRNKLIFTEPFEWLHYIQDYFQILMK